jgi:hypothetical protein
MPDTGAPWNIPYVEPTDNPRVYPQASEDLADAIADGLDAAFNPGIGSNVVQTVKTDTFTTSSTSFVDITGLTVTITPTTVTSKVLIFWNVVVSNSDSTDSAHVLLTDGADAALYRGDAEASRTRATFGSRSVVDSSNVLLSAGQFLWSPASASPVTAKLRIKVASGGTAVVNRSGSDQNFATQARSASSITVIEVAA